ncbi:hypothetical protein WJX79_001984 [Trebouxia sp. C0005]
MISSSNCTWAQLEQAGLEANPACINAYVQALVHQGDWSEAQKHFKHLLSCSSNVKAPIVTVNTIMAAYMKQGMPEQVRRRAFVSNALWVAINPNTLAFNHALTALHKAACQDCSTDLQAALAENAVGLFNQMLNRGRAPPDGGTYVIVTVLLTRVGAVGQALQVYELKLQQALSVYELKLQQALQVYELKLQ